MLVNCVFICICVCMCVCACVHVCSGVNLVLNLGVVDPGKKNRYFLGKCLINFDFSNQFPQQI